MKEIKIGDRISFMCGGECDERVDDAKVIKIDDEGIHVEWMEGFNRKTDTIERVQVVE